MYLMFADEADQDQNRHQRFFVYGAIFVEANRAWALHNAMCALRVGAGFSPDDSLKFASNTRPAGISREEHLNVKSRVMELAVEHEVRFCAYVMLHEIARNRNQDELIKWGANTLLGKFDNYCSQTDDGHGMVFFDRMPIAHEHRYLREKFLAGLTLPNGRNRPLDRIVGLASTCDGASHLSSVADIVLGSFRYCVNEPERDIAGRAMFPVIARLMWKRQYQGRLILRELGLVIRPQRIQVQRHQEEYDALVNRLNAYLAPVP